MIPLFTVMLTLISMMILVVTETYFIPYHKHRFSHNPLNRIHSELNIIGFIYDIINKCGLLFFKRTKIQNCNETNSDDSLIEIDVKMNALRKNLQQNLDTLNYLFKMESNFKSSESESKALELNDLRGILRKRVNKITKELLHCRSLKTKNIMVDYEEVA